MTGEDFQGLFILVRGNLRRATVSDLARWMAIGRGGPLRLDLEHAQEIMRGCAEDVRVRNRVAELNARPRPLGEGS